jgi:DNA-directed RNA polymerase sigma subunit (sigma70/sigma32)
MDLQRISGLLRKLSPRQEKVIRLYFGLGCRQSHSAREVAHEFGVSAQVIAGVLGAAQRRLAPDGLTFSQLREAARCEADLRHSSLIIFVALTSRFGLNFVTSTDIL